MFLSEFIKIQEIKKFVDDVFGDDLPFTVESSESIERNTSRRTEDRSRLKRYIATKSGDLIFTIFLSEKNTGTERFLPDYFGKPDYSKLLRDRFKEINKVEIDFWNVDYLFTRDIYEKTNYYEIKLKFTVRYM